MERVLLECDRTAAEFDADAVHDLRVSLRRCRSLADGLMALDPDPSWKGMKKAGKKVFQAFGELRDMQVMEEWIGKLDVAGESRDSETAGESVANVDRAPRDPVVVKLLGHIHAREAACKQEARKDLDQFDRKQWRRWSRTLPSRASRVRPGSTVYLHLALEKWTAAYDLHKHALRTRSRVGLHQLRIGIKRFRYTVENFLPRQHALWGDDLKELQDLLGEVHDLDVLWATAIEIAAFPDPERRQRWRATLDAERQKRIARYREKMVGRNSLWRVWRSQLPEGTQLRAAAMSRLRVWAGYQDPDFAHSQRVEKLALLLFDGLRAPGLLSQMEPIRGGLLSAPGGKDAALSLVPPGRDQDSRAVLQAAALMHDVGKVTGAEKHEKRSYRMIRGLSRPLGWSAREIELAAVIARYHRGSLPLLSAKPLQTLELWERKLALELAGVLRLANALDFGAIEPRLDVRIEKETLVVRVAGYSPVDRSAQEVAAARHLLELVLRRAVLVRPLRSSTTERVGVRRQHGIRSV